MKKKPVIVMMLLTLMLMVFAVKPYSAHASSDEEAKTYDAVSSATLSIDRLPEVDANTRSHILVAYFSTNDTVRAIAMVAADVLDADLYEILPVNSYSEEDLNYHQPGNRAGQEQWSGTRPGIVTLPENMEQYDTILLGYPIWGGQAPNILYTFLESADLKNVTILPFCTSNMVSPGTSAINMQAVTDASVTWLSAQRIMNHSTEEDLYEWARSLTPEVIGIEREQKMRLQIDDTPVSVIWENNDAVREMKRLLTEQPFTIEMSMYGGFEQVGSIGTNLPRNDEQTTTSSGDIVLYSGNQIVVFYGSNSWAYTRLGHISDKTPAELRELLGNHNISITLSLE